MKKIISSFIGIALVVGFVVMFFGGCAGMNRQVEMTPETAEHIGSRIAWAIRMTKWFKETAMVEPIAQLVCDAQQQVSSDKPTNLVSLFNESEFTPEQEELADIFLDGLLLEIEHEFKANGIPIEGDTEEYARFIFMVLGAICVDLG
jgi:hypothetical protein